MPSLGDRSPLPAATVDDDADYIRQIITEVSNEGHDVILMAHSYGGIPATLAVKGVTKKEREAQGLKGGVRRLLYTTAVVPDLGGDIGSVMSAGTDAPPVSTIQIEVGHVSNTQDRVLSSSQGEYMKHDPIEPLVAQVFNLAPDEVGLKWAKRFGRHSAISFAGKLSYQGYKDVPVSYMFCEEDLCVTPAMQQAGIDFIEKASGRKVDVYRYPLDHIPYLSGGVDSVVDAVNRAAAEQD
jgi:hypothetical protein